MEHNQNPEQKMKAKAMMEEVERLIPDYKDDLYGLACLIKERYGFWPTLYYDEVKRVIPSYNYDDLERLFDLT